MSLKFVRKIYSLLVLIHFESSSSSDSEPLKASFRPWFGFQTPGDADVTGGKLHLIISWIWERGRERARGREWVNQPCALDPQEHSFQMHVSSPHHLLLLPFHFFGRSSSSRRVFIHSSESCPTFLTLFFLFSDWKFCDRTSSVSPFHRFFSIELNLHLLSSEKSPHQKNLLIRRNIWQLFFRRKNLLIEIFHSRFIIFLSLTSLIFLPFSSVISLSFLLSSIVNEKWNEMKNWCFFLLTKFNEKRREVNQQEQEKRKNRTRTGKGEENKKNCELCN